MLAVVGVRCGIEVAAVYKDRLVSRYMYVHSTYLAK